MCMRTIRKSRWKSYVHICLPSACYLPDCLVMMRMMMRHQHQAGWQLFEPKSLLRLTAWPQLQGWVFPFLLYQLLSAVAATVIVAHGFPILVVHMPFGAASLQIHTCCESYLILQLFLFHNKREYSCIINWIKLKYNRTAHKISTYNKWRNYQTHSINEICLCCHNHRLPSCILWVCCSSYIMKKLAAGQIQIFHPYFL